MPRHRSVFARSARLRRAACVLAWAFVFAPAVARASLSGPITEPWWAFPTGGAVGTTGGSYRLSGSAGLAEGAAMSGGTYRISGGFWALPLGGLLDAGPATPRPERFSLAAPAPNPFAGATRFSFALPAPGRVTAEVFDVRGDRVRTLVDETRDAGVWSEAWDGNDDTGSGVRAGVYFLRVKAPGASSTRRIVRIP